MEAESETEEEVEVELEAEEEVEEAEAEAEEEAEVEGVVDAAAIDDTEGAVAEFEAALTGLKKRDKPPLQTYTQKQKIRNDGALRCS